MRGPDGDRHVVVGEASYYGAKFHGQQAASGETFDMHEYTAAHRSLPFDTMVRVTEQKTLKSVVVRIIDRGPYVDGRVIDLAKRPAKDIGLVRAGVLPVRLEILRWGGGENVADRRQRPLRGLAARDSSTR
ncbi:MAG: septal ring lytic transglycosylase RlpA family protein [Bradymonadaceae bacterium]